MCHAPRNIGEYATRKKDDKGGLCTNKGANIFFMVSSFLNAHSAFERVDAVSVSRLPLTADSTFYRCQCNQSGERPWQVALIVAG